METLALTWTSSFLLKNVPTVHSVSATVVAKVLSGGTWSHYSATLWSVIKYAKYVLQLEYYIGFLDHLL